MLSIAFEEIPEGGSDVCADLGPEWIDPLVGPQFYSSQDKVHVLFTLMRAGPSVVARGSLRGRLRFVCSRCAEETPYELAHTFTHVFVKGTHSGAIPEGFDEPESLEATFFNGETIELEPLTAEEIVLALPPVPLCSEGCKGICQHCGRNLNAGACECGADVVDPRWEKLRDIKL